MIPDGWQPSDPDVARLRDRVLASEAALMTRIADLEGAMAQWAQQAEASRTAHRARYWQVLLAVVTGVVLPLTLAGVLALIHLINR